MRSAATFGFPPFTRTVKRLVYINIGVFLVQLLLQWAGGGFAAKLANWLGLVPSQVLHGWIWQLATYSFVHASTLHILFNMLALWMFGATLENDWGKYKFLEFYFFCVVGAALVTVAVSYTGLLGMSPHTLTVGASGGIYGLLAAFGLLYGEMPVYVYGIFPIKAKVLAIIFVALALIGAFGAQGGVANFAHLGGAAFGYLYIRHLPRLGLKYTLSENYYGILNRYHRWRRRQAAKKFQVYMKKHDRNQYFDEYGNYHEPGEKPGKKKDGDGGDDGEWIH